MISAWRSTVHLTLLDAPLVSFGRDILCDFRFLTRTVGVVVLAEAVA